MRKIVFALLLGFALVPLALPFAALLASEVPPLTASMFDNIPAASVSAINATQEPAAHWLWSLLASDAAGNVLNYLLAALAGLVIRLLQLEGKKKDAAEKARQFIQAGIRRTHETYSRAIKKAHEDGKLTDAERQEANRLACQYAIDYAKQEGFNLLKVYAKDALPAVVDGVLRRIQGEAALKRVPLSPPPLPDLAPRSYSAN